MQEENVLYWWKLIAETSDETAFAKLYKHFFPGLISFSCSIIKDRQRSEEVVEDVFVKLWLNRNKGVTTDNFSQYLYTAVKNACINVIQRERKNHIEELGDSLNLVLGSSGDNLIENENLNKIADAVNALPDRCKLIFRLIKEEGLTYNQVAELLEISPKTVDAQLNIAINKIAAALKSVLPEFNVFYRRKKPL